MLRFFLQMEQLVCLSIARVSVLRELRVFDLSQQESAHVRIMLLTLMRFVIRLVEETLAQWKLYTTK